MAHGDAREGKWRGNWRMEWVDSTLCTTSEHGLSSITTADLHTLAAGSWLNWHPCRFKWTRPFRQKMKSGFCACAITFQMQSGTCCTCDRWIETLWVLLLLLGAELTLVESFGLLNNLFPFPSILDAGYPVLDLQLANVLFDVILPSVLGSSLWSFY